MELKDIKVEVANLSSKIATLAQKIDVSKLKSEFNSLEQETLKPDFWNDQKSAQKHIEKQNVIKSKLNTYNELITNIEELETMIEMYQEEQDGDLLLEIEDLHKKTSNLIEQFETSLLLTGKHDSGNAIMELHPGAGGVESADFCEIMYRMYTRYFEKKGYKTELLNYVPNEEAGLKNVSIRVIGVNAYGYLKAERGVHRFVRISPFDSNNKRHTSFVSVEVLPEIEDNVEIDISPDEIKVDTYRSSGAGGQSVNTTDSAVRMTHLPTGTVVTCQNERSQIKNREQALKLLRAKLYQIELDKQQAELNAMRGNNQEIAWGSQIRSYVFQPYTMVKDLRTKHEVGNINQVMDGDIEGFIKAYLHKYS